MRHRNYPIQEQNIEETNFLLFQKKSLYLLLVNKKTEKLLFIEVKETLITQRVYYYCFN